MLTWKPATAGFFYVLISEFNPTFTAWNLINKSSVFGL